MTATAQARVKRLRCSRPAHYVTVNHLRININGTLSRTRNVSCKTAKVMAHYVGTPPGRRPFKQPVQAARALVGDADPSSAGYLGPTVYIEHTDHRVRVIRIQVNLPVS